MAVELKGIREGLRLVWNMQIQNLELETDALAMVQMIHKKI